MSSSSLVQSCLWTVPRWVLFKDNIEQCWVNSYAVIKVRNFCCTWGTHRVTVQRPDWTRLSELMCCDKGKKFQTCSILSLNSDTMGAPSAAETSYLYHRTWVHSALFNLVFEHWHEVWREDWTRLSELMCCDKGKKFLLHWGHPSCHCSKTRLNKAEWTHLSQHMSSLSLVQSCLWTVTWWVPLVQQTLLTFITRSFCCTRGTHRVTVQRQDWTRLSELISCDKGKKLLLH
jgi:hypothetical protein